MENAVAAVAFRQRKSDRAVASATVFSFQDFRHGDRGRTGFHFENALMTVLAVKPKRVWSVRKADDRQGPVQAEEDIEISQLTSTDDSLDAVFRYLIE